MCQIEILAPKVIVCLGRVAVSHLLGGSEGITRLRGKVLRLGEIPVVPTFHPSYILHQRDKQAVSKAKWQVWGHAGGFEAAGQSHMIQRLSVAPVQNPAPAPDPIRQTIRSPSSRAPGCSSPWGNG
jgi:hypothetical protein